MVHTNTCYNSEGQQNIHTNKTVSFLHVNSMKGTFDISKYFDVVFKHDEKTLLELYIMLQ